MKKLVLLILAFWCSLVLAGVAGQVKNNSGEAITLYDTNTKCPEPLHDMLWTESGGKIKFQGCWQVEGDMVLLLWEDGDRGMGPVTAFKWGPTMDNQKYNGNIL
jgi:hypothetical protein